MDEYQKVNRRKFFKTAGMGGLAMISLPSVKIITQDGDKEIVTNEEQYGGFYIRRHSINDPPYEVDNSIYERFDAKNTTFGRLKWDEKVIETIRNTPGPDWGSDGYKQEHTALDAGAFFLAGYMGTRTPLVGKHRGLLSIDLPRGHFLGKDWRQKPFDRSHMTDRDISTMVKKAAMLYGASLVGITKLDKRWIYSKSHGFSKDEIGRIDFYDPKKDQSKNSKPYYDDVGNLQIPESMNRVIVLAFEMDYDSVMQYPNMIGGAAAMHGYSRMVATAASMATFIKELGYNAIPCGNNTGLSVPMAIDAGLGELGRQGILITPKYGPRVRLAKVITDLPLAIDQPISFGVKEFCDICMKCAKDCPGKAILDGEQVLKSDNISNNPGVKKWPIDPVKCEVGWTMSGSDCGVCIRTCPFNKIDGWLHEVTRVLIGAKSGSIDKLMLKLDDASGYGKQHDPKTYWKGDRFMHTHSYE